MGHMVYELDEQVGFVMRKAYQRHLTILSEHMAGELTAMQFSTLFRLVNAEGPVSQNALGRMVAMDAATTKGVVSRLQARGLIRMEQDQVDRRRYLLSSTEEGRALVAELMPRMVEVSEATLAPLNARERKTFMKLLLRLC
ncbi:MarR family winged helix-turn-helix transcriptional regulator [Xanthobacter sp. TB0139]|uniref:MarR family winged helix-turn-helix transcriptional regulator n=1 Tax=Xanthobacter sp. TB0139 TaxID=3459178 RepID=UPI00403A1E96